MESLDKFPCTPKALVKPYADFQDEGLLYLQPPKRSPITYTKGYSNPLIKIDGKTTYGLSYMKFDNVSMPRINYAKRERRIKSGTGKHDFDTVQKLSYKAPDGRTRRPFVPKGCLAISGSHDMATVQSLSYVHPGCANKLKSFKPLEGRIRASVPMDFETITSGSYQNFGAPIAVRRPLARKFWQTKFKTDYQTTSQLSYQGGMPIRRKINPARYRSHISAVMEKDTVYGTSYQIPGCFVQKSST